MVVELKANYLQNRLQGSLKPGRANKFAPPNKVQRNVLELLKIVLWLTNRGNTYNLGNILNA